YEEIFYEGYGPGGVAVIVETSTDNRNRTASDIRHYFDKFGGNLGTTGCVSFMFADKGVIVIENDGHDEDTFMEHALDAGAVDFTSEDGYFEVFTDPTELDGVKSALEADGYTFESAEIEKIPSTYVRLDEEDAIKMQKLLDHLEENDDAINVWHNWDE
ncbi:MAG TPA: YebC/PmpR family DNA-binding transcriptional regulator, partial [Bacillota bacterium]|nr:YebC/PmpR family DNA-binding transcriptional regulator [Bacillota bacterium]